MLVTCSAARGLAIERDVSRLEEPMEGGKANWARWALAVALVGPAAGCVAAAAGAGAGSAIYLTTRGASSTVNGSVSDVAARARSVLDGEGITITETKTESEGDERSFKGTKGDLDISVDLKRETPTTTKTEVSARKNLAEWDKDYAKTLLNKIVKGG
jgi:hypothetical protein